MKRRGFYCHVQLDELEVEVEVERVQEGRDVGSHEEDVVGGFAEFMGQILSLRDGRSGWLAVENSL